MRLAHSLMAAITALVVGCAPYPQPEPPPQNETVADLSDKTVALVVDAVDEGKPTIRAYCSGVWLNDRDFITAQHCVDDTVVGGEVRYAVRSDVFADGPIEYGTKSSRPAYLMKTDELHDLAIVRAVLAPAHSIAELGRAPLQGEPVQTMGHANGLWYSYSAGHVAGIRYVEMDETNMLWIQSTTPISGGNSGCGLFDASGKLVGIASWQFVRGQNLNFFVHGQYVAKLAESL